MGRSENPQTEPKNNSIIFKTDEELAQILAEAGEASTRRESPNNSPKPRFRGEKLKSPTPENSKLP